MVARLGLRGWLAVVASRTRRFFFFNDTATTEIYTLSLHDALPIYDQASGRPRPRHARARAELAHRLERARERPRLTDSPRADRKSTRLNSSHSQISYAVFCLKKKNYVAAL